MAQVGLNTKCWDFEPHRTTVGELLNIISEYPKDALIKTRYFPDEGIYAHVIGVEYDNEENELRIFDY